MKVFGVMYLQKGFDKTKNDTLIFVVSMLQDVTLKRLKTKQLLVLDWTTLHDLEFWLGVKIVQLNICLNADCSVRSVRYAVRLST